jgi:ribosomal protein S18 acetylase RimI-like enzyme
MSTNGHETRQPLPPVAIEPLDLRAAAATLPQLQGLLNGAYHDSHMYQDLMEDVEQAPEPFRLFVARAGEQPDTALGTAVVESKVHRAFSYLGLPPVHIKRFTVARAVRSMGIGKQLLDEARTYGFEELDLEALFVESNEIGALSMYGREGALYSLESIGEYWRRNTLEEALTYFAADITDPRRRSERYPNGEGIRFVFTKDAEAARFFHDHGYVSKDEIVKLSGITS